MVPAIHSGAERGAHWQVLTDVATHHVTCERVIAAPSDAVWSLVGDFFGNWHPAIEYIRKEKDGVTRCFTVKGEDGLYRERLTAISTKKRTLRYQHVEGIRAVHAYNATCKVSEYAGGAQVTWSADIEADEPRATEIAGGTRAVFESGLEALASLLEVKDLELPNAPKLAISAIAKREGPMLLFLHGIGGNRGNWHAQLSAVAPLLQAAAMDLRGYGGSHLGKAQTTVDDYCADILRVMGHFEKSSVILCGLSYGSWIATSFAMRHPEKLAGLVLSGGCTGMSEAEEVERQSFLMSRMKPLHEGKTPADFAENVVNVIAGPRAGAAVCSTLWNSMVQIPTETYRDAVTCFCNPTETFDFSNIHCPVLLITGEHDRLASPAEIKSVADRMRAASGAQAVQFEIIADAGHVCNLEQPQLYNTVLVQFLQGIVQ